MNMFPQLIQTRDFICLQDALFNSIRFASIAFTRKDRNYFYRFIKIVMHQKLYLMHDTLCVKIYVKYKIMYVKICVCALLRQILVVCDEF